MPVIGVQGIKGGVGTTSIVAGLGWALKTLGEPVLLIDLSPNNFLRLHFNLDYANPVGWAYADTHMKPWMEQGFHYCDKLHFLPYGHLIDKEQTELEQTLLEKPSLWPSRINSLIKKYPDWWVLIDIPSHHSALSPQGIAACSHHLMILNADGQSHSLLPYFSTAKPHHFLINRFRCESNLQKDISLLWQESLLHILPLMIHDDAVVMESIAKKIPPGFIDNHNLPRQELMSLASWCMVNCREYSYE